MDNAAVLRGRLRTGDDRGERLGRPEARGKSSEMGWNNPPGVYYGVWTPAIIFGAMVRLLVTQIPDFDKCRAGVRGLKFAYAARQMCLLCKKEQPTHTLGSDDPRFSPVEGFRVVGKGPPTRDDSRKRQNVRRLPLPVELGHSVPEGGNAVRVHPRGPILLGGWKGERIKLL